MQEEELDGEKGVGGVSSVVLVGEDARGEVEFSNKGLNVGDVGG